MKTLIVHRKFLWLIPYTAEVDRPHIRKAKTPVGIEVSNPLWLCEGGGWMGCGESPACAWNDWANWALI